MAKITPDLQLLNRGIARWNLPLHRDLPHKELGPQEISGGKTF
jgi:hypothetical protein